jgi:hypothetical protein
LDIRKFFFSEWVIDRWNRLNDQAVEVTSISDFKNQLDKSGETRKDLVMDNLSARSYGSIRNEKLWPGEASPGELPFSPSRGLYQFFYPAEKNS